MKPDSTEVLNRYLPPGHNATGEYFYTAIRDEDTADDRMFGHRMQSMRRQAIDRLGDNVVIVIGRRDLFTGIDLEPFADDPGLWMVAIQYTVTD